MSAEQLIPFVAFLTGCMGLAVLVRRGSRYGAAAALLVVGSWGYAFVELMMHITSDQMHYSSNGREYFRLAAWLAMSAMLVRLAWKRSG